MVKWIDLKTDSGCLFAGLAGGVTIDAQGALYLTGGFWDPDKGCPEWGTSDPSRVRYIGDRAGNIVIKYADGQIYKIPLVFGYTMWYHAIWSEHPTPFFDNDYNYRDSELVSSLKKALYLKGGFECEPEGVLKIALPAGTLSSVSVVKDETREGNPVFHGLYIACGEPEGTLTGGKIEIKANDSFFDMHTVSVFDPLPEEAMRELDKVCRALHTYSDAFEAIPEYEFDAAQKSAHGRFVFSGDSTANAATGIVDVNMTNLVERTDGDGFIHTSYKDAPSWRYDGFGPYVNIANSYYDAFYSRDASRAIMTLNSFGYARQAEAGCGFGNKWMMYYPEQGLTLGGIPIPGHFSVMPNKPLIYSTVLVPVANWPTKYTKEAFGDEYQNLGNQETDGHGLMMLANFEVWKNLGSDPKWVKDNWKYINEAAYWIEWCLEHTDLSLSEDGLLYGETEAAMSDWTLYANLPCYLGLLGYAQMAEAADMIAEQERWLKAAAKIKSGIDSRLSAKGGEGWDLEHKGFLHDPAPAMLSDFFGFDTADMPEAWIARSRVSYSDDLYETKKFGYYAPGGLGYGHSMITQNALLLDMMKDASELVKSLCRICYAPGLPEPYMVPEGISVDASRGLFRRQGDLGNLVQQAEAMKCFLIVAGIAPVTCGRNGNELKVMPRLPEGWTVNVAGFPVANSLMKASLNASYPVKDRQSIELKLVAKKSGSSEAALPETVKVRFGPFAPELKTATATLNGVDYELKLENTGDSAWGWVCTDSEALLSDN